jgi:hypothetical protein
VRIRHRRRYGGRDVLPHRRRPPGAPLAAAGQRLETARPGGDRFPLTSWRHVGQGSAPLFGITTRED